MIIVLFIGLLFDAIVLTFAIAGNALDIFTRISIIGSCVFVGCLILTVINQSTKIEKLQKYLHLNKDSEPETEEDKANDQNKK